MGPSWAGLVLKIKSEIVSRNCEDVPHDQLCIYPLRRATGAGARVLGVNLQQPRLRIKGVQPVRGWMESDNGPRKRSRRGYELLIRDLHSHLSQFSHCLPCGGMSFIDWPESISKSASPLNEEGQRGA